MKFSEEWLDLSKTGLAFLKWLFVSVVTGAVVGLIGVGFHMLIEYATEFQTMFPWLLFLLPLGGVCIVWLYRICGMEKDTGTNFILVSIRTNESLRLVTAPLVLIGTVITHLFGGSSGREGAALQLGSSIAATIGKLFHLNKKDMTIIIMSGMSAAFSALFGTPLTAVVFSMEVISVGVMHYSALVPCLISSFTGYAVALSFRVAPTRFTLTGIPEFALVPSIQVIILAGLCACVSILFCLCMKKISMLYKTKISNPMIRAFIGGILVIVLTYAVGCRDYNGAGMSIIGKAIEGEARPEAFLLKILFTAVTLGAGFKGGEIIPSAFVGATFGNVAGGLLGLSPSFGAGIGFVALFCGVTNCPLTSILLGLEVFGAQGLLYFGLACGVSYMLSGYYGLYSEQKILYSKAAPTFIDTKVK